MAVNKMPYPAFVKIMYHSAFGPHTMTIPTHNVVRGVDINHPGSFFAWDSTSPAMDTMVEGLINLLKAMFPSTTVFDRYEVWEKALPTGIPVLRYQKNISIAGTSVLTGWEAAVQRTYFFRATDNGAFKLILLDAPTDNLFAKYFVLTSPENAIVAELENTASAWQSRSGARPEAFKDLTIDLNETLRRKYNLR